MDHDGNGGWHDGTMTWHAISKARRRRLEGEGSKACMPSLPVSLPLPNRHDGEDGEDEDTPRRLQRRQGPKRRGQTHFSIRRAEHTQNIHTQIHLLMHRRVSIQTVERLV
jgi:hypothetical protein